MKKRACLRRGLFAVICILAMLLTSFPVTARAEGYTQKTAVEFARSMEGKTLTVDNDSYDCVDIAKEYFKVVGGRAYTSLTSLCGDPNAYMYASPRSDAAIPDGWIRKYYADGYRPQPGDVAVWGYKVGIAGPSGHVAVVVGVNGNNIEVVEQSTGKTSDEHPAEFSTYGADNPSCYIVPTFNQAAQKAASPTRYTVMVLDISGPQTFKESPNWMNVFGTKYTSDSSIESVKAAARKYLDDARSIVGDNYIAIVTYSDTGTVVSGFTDDIDALLSTLDAIQCDPDHNRSIYEGLKCAQTLMEGISDENVTKNMLLCTTGLTDVGEYNYEGWYDSGVIASTWYNEGTNVKLYAYANPAIECAGRIKDSGITIYVLGIFDPVEANLPNTNSVKEVAQFLRKTANDIASSNDTFFAVNDVNSLDFVFGGLHEDLTGSVKVRLYNDCTFYTGGEQDGKGGSSGLGGHYEEFMWGPSLFEVPATQLYRSPIISKESASYNLAMLSGCLCMNATSPDYLWQSYMDLGFQENDVYFYSYKDSPHNRSEAQRNGSKFADDEHLAFSIASKPMYISGEETDLLVIVARGTVTGWEAVKDGTCLADKDFYGYTAWDWIWEFEEDIFAGLEDYHRDHDSLGSRPLKVLVAGHSLGGAAANLTAAKFIMECGANSWFGKATTHDDIYGFTFGAIDAITDTKRSGEHIGVPVSEQFPGIINIYNYLDTFGPDGKKVFTAKGNTIYGKFGNFYTFSSDMKGTVSDSSGYMTHEIMGYVQAVKKGWITRDYKNTKIRVSIMCPVDVKVFSGDEPVCLIENDRLVSTIPQIEVYVEGSEKILLLPDDGDYNVIITATDGGTMNYMIQDLDSDDASVVAYTNIKLDPGKTITCDLSKDVPPAEARLFVDDGQGTKTHSIAYDGAESELETESPETGPESESDTSEPVNENDSKTDTAKTAVEEEDTNEPPEGSEETVEKAADEEPEGESFLHFIIILIIATILLLAAAVGITIFITKMMKLRKGPTIAIIAGVSAVVILGSVCVALLRNGLVGSAGKTDTSDAQISERDNTETQNASKDDITPEPSNVAEITATPEPAVTPEITQAPEPSDSPEPTGVPEPVSEPEHRYAFVIDGCSWTEAQNKAIEAGGRLACFDTYEEYQNVLKELAENGDKTIEYRVGGRRDIGGTKYYWVDNLDRMYGDCLNDAYGYASLMWAESEPSYHSEESFEGYLSIRYDENLFIWKLNDSSDAVKEDSSKYGYIIEYLDGTELNIPEAAGIQAPEEPTEAPEGEAGEEPADEPEDETGEEPTDEPEDGITGELPEDPESMKAEGSPEEPSGQPEEEQEEDPEKEITEGSTGDD